MQPQHVAALGERGCLSRASVTESGAIADRAYRRSA
jgi:hypothetical protein